MRFLAASILLLLSLGISNVQTSAAEAPMVEVVSVPAVTAGQGYIKIVCPSDGVTYHFNIYSITGRLEKSVALRDGSQHIDLPQGCYIVRCEKWSKKVLVN